MSEEKNSSRLSIKHFFIAFIALLLLLSIAYAILWYFKYTHHDIFVGAFFGLLYLALCAGIPALTLYLLLESKRYNLNDYKWVLAFVFIISMISNNLWAASIMDRHVRGLGIFYFSCLIIPVIVVFRAKRLRGEKDAGIIHHVLLVFCVLIVSILFSTIGYLIERNMDIYSILLFLISLLLAGILILSVFFCSKSDSADMAYSRIVYSILVVTALTFSPGRYIHRYSIDQSMERAKPIIQAINDYNRDNGSYPKNLNKLIPKYLKKVPVNAIAHGEKYKYFNEGDFVSLQFETLGFDYCYHDFNVEQPAWVCD